MRVHRLFTLLVLASVLFLPLAFGPAPVMAAETMKIALILPGRVNDPGYYNAGYQALLAAEKHYNAEVAYQEALKTADAEQVLRVFADDGFTYIIVMGGGTYDDQIRSVAADYPELKFIIISGTFTELPNIVSIRTGNPGVNYMAGMLMAELSQNGKIGLVGGRATPPAIGDHVGVIAGARAVRPDIVIFDAYTENNENPALGKEAALAQIEQGADILFTNANTTSFGVIQAAQERGILAVGAATDQNHVAPGTVLTSAVYGMDNAMIWLIDLDLTTGWENKLYTMDISQVDLAPFHELEPRVTPDMKKRLADVRADLLAGKINVPTTYEAIGFSNPLHKK